MDKIMSCRRQLENLATDRLPPAEAEEVLRLFDQACWTLMRECLGQQVDELRELAKKEADLEEELGCNV